MKNETLVPSMSLRFVEREIVTERIGEEIYTSKLVKILQQRFTKPGSDKPIWRDVPVVSEDCQ